MLFSRFTRRTAIRLITAVAIATTTMLYGVDIQANGVSITEIQSAIDRARSAGGGTVYLPPGENTAGGRLRLYSQISLIGSGMDKTILHNTVIYVNPEQAENRDLQISGFFLATNSRMEIRKTRRFRVDHVAFQTKGAISLNILQSYEGVIDNCAFDSGNYGIVVTFGSYAQYSSDWNEDTLSLLGSKNAIFVEDSEFWNYHHAIVGHSNGHYVARHSMFYGGGRSPGHAIDAHGPGYSKHDDPENTGTRLVECYNNVIIGSNNGGRQKVWKAIAIRGGAAVIFDNEIIDWRNGVIMALESDFRNYNPGNRPKDIWIWDNTRVNNPGHTYWEKMAFLSDSMNDNDYDNDGKADELYATWIREGVEYHLDSAPPGYVPYEYPHPLRIRLDNPKARAIEQKVPLNLSREISTGASDDSSEGTAASSDTDDDGLSDEAYRMLDKAARKIKQLLSTFGE